MTMRRLTSGFAAGSLLLVAGFTGCNLEWGGGEGSVATADVHGTWQYADTSADQWTMIVTQAVSSLTGGTTGGGSLEGAVNGNAVILTVSNGNALIDYLVGTVTNDIMSGAFSNNLGVKGEWTAVRTEGTQFHP